MSFDTEKVLLEERKVKALEKIANNLDNLSLWFEEIDKEEWGDRIAWYLSLWKEKYIGDIDEKTGDNSSVQK
tara:strand:+ start:2834 stop:3049 length:216 start_codon:yes stop_codon:yes gene_type:complete